MYGLGKMLNFKILNYLLKQWRIVQKQMSYLINVYYYYYYYFIILLLMLLTYQSDSIVRLIFVQINTFI